MEHHIVLRVLGHWLCLNSHLNLPTRTASLLYISESLAVLNRAEFYAIDCNWCDYTTSELFNALANLCMEEIEESAINSSFVPPKIWKRYVDESFCIIKKDNVPAFHDTLNSIDANISFTIEIESDNKISFLDTLVTRRNVPSLWYPVTSLHG